MAKLRALLLAAAWPIVVLVMIVLVTSPSPVGATVHDWFSKSNSIDDIRKIPAGQRTEKEWRKLAKDCIKSSSITDKSDKKWLSELSLFTKYDCNRQFANELLENLINTKNNYPACFGTIREYFSLYLDSCGYTEQFKKVLEVTQAIKQESADHLSFADDQTLEKYLIDSLLQKISGNRYETAVELSEILVAIREISEFASNPEETQCSKAFKIYGAFSNEVDRPYLHRFRKLHFKFYLDKCGFEEAFKKMGENINQISHDSLYKTLYSHLEGKFSVELDLSWAFSAIETLFALKSGSEETHCTEILQNKLLNWLRKSEHDQSELHELISGYFALYLDKCGFEQFLNERIEHMKPRSGQHWNLDEFPTLHSYLLQELWDSGQQDVSWIMSAMKTFSAVERMSKQKACTNYRVRNLLKKLWNSVQFATFRLIAADHFAVYLEKCGYEEILKRRIEHMGPDGGWDLDEYPTLHSYLWEIIWKRGEPVVSQMLTVLKDLSGIEGISKQVACTNKYHTFLLERVFDKARFTSFSAITADFFSLYLEKCGLEASFKKRVDSIDRNLDKKWDSDFYPNFHSLIRHKFWSPSELGWVLAMMKKLSVLDGTSEEIDCSEEFISNFSVWLSKSSQADGDLHTLTKNYYALYLDKCGYGDDITGDVTEVDKSRALIRIIDRIM